MSHVDRRRVRDVVRDAALLVLADGERAVVRPRQPRIPLIARRADIYQSAVEGREARVADVVRRVREDDRVDDRADAGRGRAEAPRDVAAVLEDERRAERPLSFFEQRLVFALLLLLKSEGPDALIREASLSLHRSTLHRYAKSLAHHARFVGQSQNRVCRVASAFIER